MGASDGSRLGKFPRLIEDYTTPARNYKTQEILCIQNYYFFRIFVNICIYIYLH